MRPERKPRGDIPLSSVPICSIHGLLLTQTLDRRGIIGTEPCQRQQHPNKRSAHDSLEHSPIVVLVSRLPLELRAGSPNHVPVVLEQAKVGRVADLVVAVSVGGATKRGSRLLEGDGEGFGVGPEADEFLFAGGAAAVVGRATTVALWEE